MSADEWQWAMTRGVPDGKHTIHETFEIGDRVVPAGARHVYSDSMIPPTAEITSCS
jgi:hypothetical protein